MEESPNSDKDKLKTREIQENILPPKDKAKQEEHSEVPPEPRVEGGHPHCSKLYTYKEDPRRELPWAPGHSKLMPLACRSLK